MSDIDNDNDFPPGTVTYYVSPTGNDSNTGLSPSDAWETIVHVNAQTFNPGEAILFAGGQIFSGAIVSPSSGTGAAPIIFGSYGGGQATISSGNSNGFTSTNQAGIVVRDLTFIGTASTNKGILFLNDSSSAIRYQNIQIINITVSGFGQDGIMLWGSVNGSAGYDDVLIEGCDASACCTVAVSGIGSAGIQAQNSVALSGQYSFRNLTIKNCYSHDNLGCTDSSWTGSGIFIGSVEKGLITACYSYNNGQNSSGTVGIWTAAGIDCTIDSCVSERTRTGSAIDGDGYDIEGGSVNCIISNCIARNNDGSGFLIYSYSFGGHDFPNVGSQLLNCVSENDGAGLFGYPGIELGSGYSTTEVKVDNCTVYQSGGTVECLAADSTITGVVIGCSFIKGGNQNFINATGNPSSLLFNGNKYFSANQFKVTWNSVTYTSLLSWHMATSQETFAAADLSVSGSGILGGNNGQVIYDNAGTVGEAANFTISSGNPNVTSGNTYLYDDTNALFETAGDASGPNWFIGNAGNFTATGGGNVGMGDKALFALTSGARNFGLGKTALTSLTNSSSNVAIGWSALFGLIDGSNNTAIGQTAGQSIVNSSNNVLIGSQAAPNLTGQNTIAIGVQALNAHTVGAFNGGYHIAIGTLALANVDTGIANIGIGDSVGATITSATQCLVIGASCDVPSASANGQMSICNFLYGTGLTGQGSTISTGWIGVGQKAAFGSEAFGVTGGITLNGDPGGVASTNTITGVNSTTISTGVGAIHMSTANPATNSGWIKFYIGTQVAWIPCWTTNAP